MNKKWIIGIDEVGRGPLAGPVAVCAFAIPAVFQHRVLEMFQGARDSKKMSEKQRGKWFRIIRSAEKDGLVDYRVSFCANTVVDKKGIAYAIRSGVNHSLTRFNFDPKHCTVFLDGGLRAPEEYKTQQTIIRGDATKIPIMLASIVAKVSRDRRMKNYAKKYPLYGFEQHKGYGTTAHIRAIQEHGVCAIHRMSFLTRVVA